jgi:DNA-binding response OmpR family regulator
MHQRILFCDDELHILRAAEFKFKRAGYEVLSASDGEEGWELVRMHQPQLVITDCQMPRLSGLGLAERMKSHPDTAGIPVIMLSGKGFELSAAGLLQEYGIVALLPKPFSPRDLFQRVEALLGAGGEPLPATSAASAAAQWL